MFAKLWSFKKWPTIVASLIKLMLIACLVANNKKTHFKKKLGCTFLMMLVLQQLNFYLFNGLDRD